MSSYDELHRKWKDAMADRGHIGREVEVEHFKQWIEDKIEVEEKTCEEKAVYYLEKTQELLCQIGMEADADTLYEVEKKVV